MYAPKVPCGACLHLLCRFPLLVVPLVLGVVFSSPCVKDFPLSQAMITFCFDDGYISTYENAYPILQQYGFVGTVFAVTANIDTPGFMGVAELRFLYNEGWEIASHTVTHPYLTELSPQEVRYELEESLRFFASRGFDIYSIASPFGDHNPEIIAAMVEHYFAHRTGWPEGLNDIPILKDEDRYLLKVVVPLNSTTVDEVRSWILRAKKEGKWLILVFHRIDHSAGEYSWTPEQLEAVVKFSFEQGFKGASLNFLR